MKMIKLLKMPLRLIKNLLKGKNQEKLFGNKDINLKMWSGSPLTYDYPNHKNEKIIDYKIITRNTESRESFLIKGDIEFEVESAVFYEMAFTPENKQKSNQEISVFIGNRIEKIRNLDNNIWTIFRFEGENKKTKIRILCPNNIWITPPKRFTFENKECSAKAHHIVVIFIDSLSSLVLNEIKNYQKKSAILHECEKFFKNGVFFSNSYSVGEYTFPVISSIFTGLYPSEHRCITYLNKPKHEIELLAETLTNKGYQCFAFTGAGYINPAFGWCRGFNTFVYQSKKSGYNNYNAALLIDKALQYLTLNKFQNTFTYLHLLDTHPPWHFSYNKPTNAIIRNFRDGDTNLEYEKIKFMEDKDAKEYFLKRFEIEIQLNDLQLSPLFSLLERKEFSNSTVILTGDHGIMPKYLDRWSTYQDGKPLFLTSKSLKVPLYFKSRKSVQNSIKDDDRIVNNSLDIYATVLNEAGIENEMIREGLALNSDIKRDFVISESFFGGKKENLLYEIALIGKDYRLNRHFPMDNNYRINILEAKKPVLYDLQHEEFFLGERWVDNPDMIYDMSYHIDKYIKNKHKYLLAPKNS